MCGRYGLVATAEELGKDFPGLRVVDPIVVGYNLCPGRKLSVLISEEGQLRLRSLSWGLRTANVPKPLVNVRAEGISRHPLFSGLFSEHRCLVLASHFFEWLDDSEPRQPFVIRPMHQAISTEARHRRLNLAAIQLGGTFAVLTTRAVGKLSGVHGRMPVLLEGVAARSWLNPALHETWALREAITPLLEAAIEIYPVVLKVNDPRADGATLLDPLPTERQRRERYQAQRY